MQKTSTAIESRGSKSQPAPAICYRLSENYFLDKGWTAQPNISLVLPVVVMKAKFSHAVISPWFQPRLQTWTQNYPDGRNIVTAYPDGSGKIYYPNGELAIKIEKGGLHNHRTRVWVYSSGEVDYNGQKHSPQLCALFDSLGNGVVYDYRMNKRLVYNQKMGIWWDTPYKMPVIWQWHNILFLGSKNAMNEDDERQKLLPDPLKKILLDALVSASKSTTDEDLKSTRDSHTFSPSVLTMKLTESEINFRETIEHFRYVDTGKMLPRSVSPVKPIVLRINKYLTLRIFSQSEIFLSFFTKAHQTKLQIGVLYNPFDKLKVVEIEDPSVMKERVICAFEGFPPRTLSMLNFKEMVQDIRAKY